MKKIFVFLGFIFFIINNCYAEKCVTTRDKYIDIVDNMEGCDPSPANYFWMYKNNKQNYEKEIVGKVSLFDGQVNKVKKSNNPKESYILEIVEPNDSSICIEIVFPNEICSNAKNKIINIKKGKKISILGKVREKFIVDALCFNNERNELEINLDSTRKLITAAVLAINGLNLRKEPNLKSAVVGNLNFGEIVQIDEEGRNDSIDGVKSNWYKVCKISGNCDEGWCFGGYLLQNPNDYSQFSLGDLLKTIDNLEVGKKIVAMGYAELVSNNTLALYENNKNNCVYVDITNTFGETKKKFSNGKRLEVAVTGCIEIGSSGRIIETKSIMFRDEAKKIASKNNSKQSQNSISPKTNKPELPITDIEDLLLDLDSMSEGKIIITAGYAQKSLGEDDCIDLFPTSRSGSKSLYVDIKKCSREIRKIFLREGVFDNRQYMIIKGQIKRGTFVGNYLEADEAVLK